MSTLLPPFTRHPLRLAAATVVLALAASLSLSVHAAPPPHGGPGGEPMMMMGGPGGHVEQMLDVVKATAEQRAQIRAIMGAAHDDMKAQRESHRALRDEMMAAFTQPSVDARTVEAVRQKMLAQHDQASKRMTQAMLDVSRVLTPEQRQLLAKQMTAMHADMERNRPAGMPPPLTRQ